MKNHFRSFIIVGVAILVSSAVVWSAIMSKRSEVPASPVVEVVLQHGVPLQRIYSIVKNLHVGVLDLSTLQSATDNKSDAFIAFMIGFPGMWNSSDLQSAVVSVRDALASLPEVKTAVIISDPDADWSPLD